MASEYRAGLDDTGGLFCGYGPLKAFCSAKPQGACSSPRSRPRSDPHLDHVTEGVNNDPPPSRKRGILSKFRGLHWKWPRRVRSLHVEVSELRRQAMAYAEDDLMEKLKPVRQFPGLHEQSADEQDSLYRDVPRKRGYYYGASLALGSTTSASDTHTEGSHSTRPTSCHWCGSTMSIYAQGGDPARMPNGLSAATPASAKFDSPLPRASPPHIIRPSVESGSSAGGPATLSKCFQSPGNTKPLPPIPLPSSPPLILELEAKYGEGRALKLDMGGLRPATPNHSPRDPNIQSIADASSVGSDDYPLGGFGSANSKRNTEFHAFFPNVPSDDDLVEDYECALRRDVLVQGRLYVTSNRLCFRPNGLGPAANLVLSFDEIIELEKKAVSHGVPGAIQVGIWSAKYTFVSFLSREVAFKVIHNIWRLLHPYWPGSSTSLEHQLGGGSIPAPMAGGGNPEVGDGRGQPVASPRKLFDSIAQPGSMVGAEIKECCIQGLKLEKIKSAQSMFECLVEHGCPNLTLQVNHRQFSSRTVTGGSFGDIWTGRLLDGTEIAIKVWRFTSLTEDTGKSLKRAMREIYNWSKADHENVHKLLGVIMFKGRLGMVSRWMENGNLRDYIRKTPGVDRYKLCVQVARGVVYLHSMDIVHGDLKACNILVSGESTAKLADFDYSVMSSYSLKFSETTRLGGGTLRWMAPELVLDPLCHRSKESDIYALGMTLLEIMTGMIPYYPEFQTDAHVIVQLTRKSYPSRTDHFGGDWRGDLMWTLLLRCWNYDPCMRPTAHDVLSSMACLVPLYE